jgi:putative tryptophan/tyrosine transport system substrate-binding protein
MRRRDFINAVAGAVTVWPIAARAQQAIAPVVGILESGSPGGLWTELLEAFRQGLSEAGYSEGHNVTI